MIGIAITYGNTGSRLSIRLSNGTVIQAIAANVVNSSKVLVLKEGQTYHAWGETPPLEILNHRSGVKVIPKEQKEAEITILPFQVLFTPNIQLGGDRNQIQIYNLTPSVAGINNLGGQKYVAVWLAENQIIVDRDGSQLFLLSPNISSYHWLGNGILTANIYPAPPIEDLTVVTTGQSLPSDFDIPLYPVFFQRSFNERVGIKTQQQQDEGYNYIQTEIYNYRNQKTGDAPNPTPTIFDLNAVCNFTTSGAFETQVYQRDTKTDYVKTISQILDKPVQVWFNNSAYEGARTESYTETYDYQASSALFVSSTSFQCRLIAGDPVFGFYQWQETSNTQANWSGETTVTNRNYTNTIDEPDWDRPITPNYFRTQRHIRRETYTENTTYSVPSNSWAVPVGSFFLFETPGTEERAIAQNITEDKITPNPLLISGDGNSVLFVETIETLTQQLSGVSTRDIPKFLYNNTTEVPNTTSELETTIVNKTEDSNFWLYFNEEGFGIKLFEIKLDDSWLFSVNTNRTLGLGVITISNDDNTSILESKINKAIAYRKEEDKVNGNIEYFDQEIVTIPWWDSIEFRPIYAITADKRYRGVLLSYSYQDTEDEELPIETVRSVTSITLDLEEVENYPSGLVETREILIIPQDNCSILLRDFLLNDENKKYCNLVGNFLYFAKSVKDNLEQTEQVTEVYAVGETVTQETPETGVFVPISGESEVLGISYFPS